MKFSFTSKSFDFIKNVLMRMMDIFRPSQIVKRFFRYNYTLPLARLVTSNLICKYDLLVYFFHADFLSAFSSTTCI